jgi:long-chain acyl-CoA synthetase
MPFLGGIRSRQLPSPRHQSILRQAPPQPEPTMPRQPENDRAPATFPELVDGPARAHGARCFLLRRQARRPEPVAFVDLVDDVHDVAAGLLTLGIQHGDRIGLLAENRYEWLLTDLATVYIGAVDVPRGSDTSPAEMAFILRHSGSRATFCEDDATAEAILQQKDSLPELEQVIVLQETTRLDSALTLTDLRQRGQALRQQDASALSERAAAVRPDDLLTIVYTSGTTAEPKGVMLTHGNVLSNVTCVRQVLHITESDRFLSVLPAWHMYERIMDYLALTAGSQLVYTDRRTIKQDLAATTPTIFAAVPRIWEMIHDGLVTEAHRRKGLAGKLLRAGISLSRAVGSGHAKAGQRLLHRLLRPLVLDKVNRAITGGSLRLAVSGGGALPRHVDETLLGIGLPLLNGYGLTETSPVAAVRHVEHNQPGTIGPPIPQTEIEVRTLEGQRLQTGETGVLWIRGPQIMRGYYHNESRTQEVLDQDGWFNSGDLGHVDHDGLVWITGRAKDTIVLASGENVEPEPVETAVKTSRFIQQAVCLGQDQKSVTALLVIDPEALAEAVQEDRWQQDGCVLRSKEVQDLLRGEIDRLLTRDAGFRPVDRIAAFRAVTEPLTIDNGCLTHTLKVRRHIVLQHYAPVIAELLS